MEWERSIRPEFFQVNKAAFVAINKSRQARNNVARHGSDGLRYAVLPGIRALHNIAAGE
jgi:hypothetical protein